MLQFCSASTAHTRTDVFGLASSEEEARSDSRSGRCRILRNLLLVQALELVVLPFDDRLAAHAREELSHLDLLTRVVHLVGHQIAHALERLRRCRLEGFELEQL